ncbi:hypothetical protein L208DRAFT_120241 [Tricholoma matsutake]|nr:hypothetical protein L208DRAFT_120241 [Tricholoma matsutake 945]
MIWEGLDQNGVQSAKPDDEAQAPAPRSPNSDLNSLVNEEPGEDDGFTVMVEELQDPLLKPLYQGLPPLPFMCHRHFFLYFFLYFLFGNVLTVCPAGCVMSNLLMQMNPPRL